MHTLNEDKMNPDNIKVKPVSGNFFHRMVQAEKEQQA